MFKCLFVKIELKLTVLEYLLVSCEFKTSTITVASIPEIETSVILRFRGSEESFQVESDNPSEVVRVELRWATVFARILGRMKVNL